LSCISCIICDTSSLKHYKLEPNYFLHKFFSGSRYCNLSEFFLLIVLAYISQIPIELGHAVKSDSYWAFTVETCIQTLASPCQIHVGQGGTRTGFIRRLRKQQSLCSLHKVHKMMA